MGLLGGNANKLVVYVFFTSGISYQRGGGDAAWAELCKAESK